MKKPKPQTVDKSIHLSNITVQAKGDEVRSQALVHLADAARENAVALQAIAEAFGQAPTESTVIKVEQAKD